MFDCAAFSLLLVFRQSSLLIIFWEYLVIYCHVPFYYVTLWLCFRLEMLKLWSRLILTRVVWSWPMRLLHISELLMTFSLTTMNTDKSNMYVSSFCDVGLCFRVFKSVQCHPRLIYIFNFWHSALWHSGLCLLQMVKMLHSIVVLSELKLNSVADSSGKQWHW